MTNNFFRKEFIYAGIAYFVYFHINFSISDNAAILYSKYYPDISEIKRYFRSG